jgi:hypothetical protein
MPKEKCNKAMPLAEGYINSLRSLATHRGVGTSGNHAHFPLLASPKPWNQNVLQMKCILGTVLLFPLLAAVLQIYASQEPRNSSQYDQLIKSAMFPKN